METTKYAKYAAKRLTLLAGKAEWRVRDGEGRKLIAQVQAEKLTYLECEALSDLRQRAKNVEVQRIPGAIVETGCALGGSAIVLARSKAPNREMYVYDVFGMIPPPGDYDGDDVKQRYATIIAGGSEGIGGQKYYGYESGLLAKVEANFHRFGVNPSTHGVHLVEGLFHDTLHPQGPVALAHIDGDWYESVKVCLDRLWPVMSRGGVIVVDDYYSWTGCRRAVDEFIAAATDCRVERHIRLQLIKDNDVRSP
jgi:Macrocin-O-methyltransferase (TylF)